MRWKFLSDLLVSIVMCLWVYRCVVLQIPRYIITIHELLAHTPHDHVERKSLEYAQSKLEELSQVFLASDPLKLSRL